MAVKQPQRDLPRGVRGGSDVWDQEFAGGLLTADYFESAAPPVSSTPTLLGVVPLTITSVSPGALPLEVPAGAQGVVVMSRAGFLSGLSITTDFAGAWQNVPPTSGVNFFLQYAPVTATGSRSLTPVFSGDGLFEGPAFFVIFVSGIDNSSFAAWVRDATCEEASPKTVSSTIEDLVVAADLWYTVSAAIPPNETGWTSQSTQVQNSVGARLRTADSPGASTTTATAQTGAGGVYSGLCLISLIGTSGGGTETDLTVADMAHAHSLDAATLASGSVLAAADLSHGQTLDAVVLATGVRIVPADLTHAHSLESTALAVDATVAPTDLSHAHTLDAVTLSAQVTLAIADLVHAHALDAVTLSTGEATSLTVADMLHGHALESVSLSAQVALAVQDLAQAHRLEGVSLSTVVGLVVARLVHGHALEAVELDDVPALAVQDLRHAHALDSVALSTLATLVVADMLHAHRLDGVTLSGGDVETERALVVRGRPRNWTVRGSRRNWRIQ